MRLGSGPNDAQDVMAHAFFVNINWDDIYHKRIEPPFKPSISNATDTSNFDSEFTSVTPVLTPVQSGMVLRPGVSNAMANIVVFCSAYAGNARRVPWIFICPGLCLIQDCWLWCRYVGEANWISGGSLLCH